MTREPYRLFQPTIIAVGLAGALAWLAESLWMRYIGEAPFVLVLLAFFLFSRALVFPPGMAVLGRHLPSADARFDLTMPALCALVAGAGPLALSTAVYIGYGLEVFTRRQRVDRAAFNAGKIAVSGLVATYAAMGTLPQYWQPVVGAWRFLTICVVLALCDAVISSLAVALRENRPPGRWLVRGMIDAGIHWDALGGLVAGFAIVYVYTNLDIPATVGICALLGALVWMERRTKALRAELARAHSDLAALQIAEPHDALGRNAGDMFFELSKSLGLDILGLYSPAPGDRALALLAGTAKAPQRIPLVAGSNGPLERALAGQIVEIEDFRAASGTALAPGTERWRATLATPLQSNGGVIAVLLATRTTPFLPAREACLQLHDAALQLSKMLANRLAAEERLRLRSQEIYREVIAAATGGRLELVERNALESYLAIFESLGKAAVSVPRDVRAARSLTERASAASGLDAARTHDLVLCVSETATNVLKHAGQGEVEILRDGERLIACVRDAGPGIPFSQLPKATLMRGFSSKPSLGYGFTFLLEFLDHIRLATGDWGTIVAMEVELRAREDFDALLAAFESAESGAPPAPRSYYRQR